MPRDCEGSFEPQIIGKHERRFTGFDQKIVARYARGMTVHAIQGYLLEMFGTEVSPECISKVNDEVMALVDGLKGLAGAIEVAFPATTVQACIVYLIRNSPGYATWKDRKAVAAALRPVYTAATVAAAQGGNQAAVAGASQCDQQFGKTDPRVEDRDEPIRDPVRRTIHEFDLVKPASHTEILAGSPPWLSPRLPEPVARCLGRSPPSNHLARGPSLITRIDSRHDRCNTPIPLIDLLLPLHR